jgi:hypothetical protein
VRRSDLPTVPVRELKRLKRSGAHTWGDGVPGQRSIRVPREYDRVSSAPVARGRQSHGAFLSARQNMISLMKKLRVTLKRTGNVVSSSRRCVKVGFGRSCPGGKGSGASWSGGSDSGAE